MRPTALVRLLAIFSAILLFPTFGQAQGAPDTLSFQGYLTDTGGAPITDPSVSMTVKLYREGVAIWEEVHPNVAINEGVFSLQLGETTPLDTLAFNAPFELGISVDGDPEIIPRAPLAAAPYAKALPGMYTYYRDDGTFAGYNVVGGASNNTVASGVVSATIAGGGGIEGLNNRRNEVNSDYGTIGGGGANTIVGDRGTIAGGFLNQAGSHGAVGGGAQNMSGLYAAVAGGGPNRASGSFSAIPGGGQNYARGSYSFAAGYNARANHEGSFVWSDRSSTATADSIFSTAANQFLVRASGGVGIGTSSPDGLLDIDNVLKIQTDQTGADNQNVRVFLSESNLNEAYGYSLIYAGATPPQEFDTTSFNLPANQLHFVRHNDSVEGVAVLSMDRSSGDISMASDLTVNGLVESQNQGFKFPDGTVQTTAAGSSAAWSLSGNAGTNPATDFVGTTDSTDFEVRVNDSRAARIEPANDGDNVAPNIVLGASNNIVSAGVVGATISGGGGVSFSSDRPNRVLEDYGTVGGGMANDAHGIVSTVAGGDGNNAGGHQSFVGGGQYNSASGTSSAVVGGAQNSASVGSSFVGGGNNNAASAYGAAIGGGEYNVSSNFYTLVGGGYGNQASGQYAAVGGGLGNVSAGDYAFVGGGASNRAAGNYSHAAGRLARALHDGAFVWADQTNANFESTAADQFLIRAGGGVGIGTNVPLASIHVENADYGLAQANLNLDDIVVESADAIVGLYSPAIGTWGSGVTLGEIDGAGGLNNKWTMVREAGLADGHLHFKFGTNSDYGPNLTFLRIGTDSVITANALIRPWLDDTYDLGTPTRRWQDIHLVNNPSVTSDARLKTDIEDLQQGLEEVLRLRPVSFRWKKTLETSQHLGLLAQDVEAVVPEVVQHAVEDDRLSIRYGDLIPVLIRAIQEQQEIIESQDRRLAELEARSVN